MNCTLVREILISRVSGRGFLGLHVQPVQNADLPRRGQGKESAPPWEIHARSLPLCHPSRGLIELSYQQISHRGSRGWHSQKDTHMGATNFKQRGVAKRSTEAPVKVLSPAHREGAPAGHHAAPWPLVSATHNRTRAGVALNVVTQRAEETMETLYHRDCQ